jgi:hypothetical protein
MMLASLMTVIYAWSRIVFYPTATIWLIALTTAPPLGWPPVERWRLWAAWGMLLFVPVWGAVRLGEADVVWLLILAAIATAPQHPRWGGIWWIAALAVLAWSCQSFVLDRAGACLQSPATGGWTTWVLGVGAWMMAMLAWPRATLPQRMVVLTIGLIAVRVASAPWGLWWIEAGLTPIVLVVSWWWLRRQSTWVPPAWMQTALVSVLGAWYVWVNWGY